MKNFVDWLNQMLSSEFPLDMIAVNFNLYE